MNWERVQDLVEGALALPHADRKAFVEQAADGDAALRDEVLSLLAATAVESPPSLWLGVLSAPEVDRFERGDRVADRYLIERLLGRGGMGEVYEAFDEELGITVALKTMREVESGASERLKLEGMLARSVWHPNVCRVYELGRHEESLWFLTMERLEGPTLLERLREAKRFTPEQALAILADVAGGLGAAHRAGVVHRDLKPSNVMLVSRDGEEHAVVTDFGISRSAGESDERPGIVFGTPDYMAPEQRKGLEVGPAADIYALGVLAHQMVTGTLPGEGEGLDPAWSAVVERCMHADPRKRFARAEDVVDALRGRKPAEPEHRAALGWPAERDAFVGRAADLDALDRARLDGARMVTLVGPGGMGKTRLSIRFGARASEDFPGGAWFCDLTEAEDAGGIAATVGRALGIQLVRGDVFEQLGHAIATRGRCLLVLDNFEQVVAHAAGSVGRWRLLAPEATFLVTSRARLQLEDERAIAVEPLSESEAYELFAIRARGLRPGLVIEEPAAREIVRHLDGIPLAIELAAARTRVMSLARIAENLRKRFRLLAGGSGARHETLEGTIAESWELLTPWERAAWAQCSVFEGGCTLDAATAVLQLTDAPPVVDVLQSLVDQSLLRTLAPPPGAAIEVRFGMYVALQEYARMKLRASPDEERAAEVRHGVHYASYGSEESIALVDRIDGPARRRRLARDLDNLLGACRRAILRRDGPVIASTYRAAWAVLRNTGPLEAAIALGRDALADPELRGIDRARVAMVLGDAENLAGDYAESRVHCQEARAIAHEFGDRPLEARVAGVFGRAELVYGKFTESERILEEGLAVADRAGSAVVLNALGMTLIEQGRPEKARACYEESLAIARETGDRTQESITLVSLGILHHRCGRLTLAAEHFTAALEMAIESGNRRSEGICHLNFSSVRTDQGQLDGAREHAEAALAIAQSTGMRTQQGTALTALGELASQMGDLAEAEAFFERALEIHEAVGDRRTKAFNLANLARVHLLRGELESARAGYERAIEIHREVGSRYYEIGDTAALADVLFRLGKFDEAGEALDSAEPALRELQAGHQLSGLLCTRAELAHARGDFETARAALAEAEVLAAESGIQPRSELGELLIRARAALTKKAPEA